VINQHVATEYITHYIVIYYSMVNLVNFIRQESIISKIVNSFVLMYINIK